MTGPESLQSLLIHSLLHDLKNQAHHLVVGLDQLPAPAGRESEWRRLQGEAATLGDQLTHALLAIRLDSHQHGLHTEATNLQKLLEDVVEDLQARQPAGSPVQILCHPCAGIVHFLDAQLVEVTLRAATDNAIRHARSRVELSAAAEPDGLHLIVEDDGAGFPVAWLRDTVTSDTAVAEPQARRTGLGLLLARLVAEAHRHDQRHGQLLLGCSETLGGARFELHLP